MQLVIGADHGGFELKRQLAEHLKAAGHEITDIGCYDANSVDYPGIAAKLAETLKEKPAARGILCCGSGIGVSMMANRFPWVRAAVIHDHFAATMSRRHNNANVACMGGRVIAPAMACELLDAWLATDFEGGRHQRRVDMMGTPTDTTAPC